jgi:integrase
VYLIKGKRGNFWYYDIRINGRRIRQKTDALTRAEALEYRRAALNTADRDRHGLPSRKAKAILFTTLCEEFLKWSKANKKSYRQDEGSARRMQEFFSGPIDRITTFQVEKCKRQLAASPPRHPTAKKNKTVSHATVNRHIACLKTMLNKAVEWRMLEKNPATAVKLYKETFKPYYVISADEESRLLEAADRMTASPYLKPVILVALHTGMRQGEILGMTWDNVDLERRIITVPITKSGEMKQVRMNSTVKDALTAWTAHGTEGDVFPVSGVKRSWEKARALAGISCRFHDMRHTCASRLVERGVALRAVQKALGHKTMQMTERYSHLSDDYMAEAMERLCEPSVAAVWPAKKERATG